MELIVDRIRLLATCVGALALARWGFGLASGVAFFLRKSGVQRYLQPSTRATSIDQESWALITGSSAGLGKGLAFDLASRGFNIILHGSNEPKLRAAQKELEAAYPLRSVRILVLDAFICSKLPGPQLKAKLDDVVDSLRDIQLRILINNVGMPQARPEVRPPFDAIDTFTYEELLHNVSGNALFPLLITRALYPLLIRNQPALIINIGSLASIGAPLLPSYGPSKAFCMTSAAELRLESRLEGHDIEVLGIDVLGVTGTDTIKHEPNLMVPDPATYARAVVQSIGCDRPRVAPYLPQALALWTLSSIPLWLRDRMFVNIIRTDRLAAAKELGLVPSSTSAEKKD